MKLLLRYALISTLTCATTNVLAETNSTNKAPASLAMSTKLIQDKLNEVGTLNYEVLLHQSTNNADFTNVYSFTLSNMIVSPKSCSINGKIHAEIAGKVLNDGKYRTVLLKDINEVHVMPVFQFMSMTGAASGHPEITGVATNPENVFAVVLAITGDISKDPALGFRDEDTANQVAEAINNAAKICRARSVH